MPEMDGFEDSSLDRSQVYAVLLKKFKNKNINITNNLKLD
jgi:hypothetical protein